MRKNDIEPLEVLAARPLVFGDLEQIAAVKELVRRALDREQKEKALAEGTLSRWIVEYEVTKYEEIEVSAATEQGAIDVAEEMRDGFLVGGETEVVVSVRRIN